MTDTKTTTTKETMTSGLRFARWAWVVAAGATIALVIRRMDGVWSEASAVGLKPEYFNAVNQYTLSVSQDHALEDIGLSSDWHGAFVMIRLVLVAAAVIGISTMLWRRARTWAPLFLSWMLLNGLLLTTLTDDDTSGELPPLLGLPVLVLFGGGVISMLGLLLVFPDDRNARWVVAVMSAAALVPLYASVTDNDAIGDWMWNNAIYVVVATLTVGLGVQTLRVVKSRDRTARDLLMLTVAMLIVMAILGSQADRWSGIEGSRDGLASLAQRLGYETLFMAVPLSYGLAVLWILVRRGHWDMDVQFKGSVGYAGLTTFLVLGYFGIVAVVQAILNDVSGAEGNTFALMISTAVIAAAFLPARAGLQRLVDRVFDRRRRDAERRVESFETEIVRDSRPDEVGGALIGVVDDVFRPEHADLWLVGGTDS